MKNSKIRLEKIDKTNKPGQRTGRRSGGNKPKPPVKPLKK